MLYEYSCYFFFLHKQPICDPQSPLKYSDHRGMFNPFSPRFWRWTEITSTPQISLVLFALESSSWLQALGKVLHLYVHNSSCCYC